MLTFFNTTLAAALAAASTTMFSDDRPPDRYRADAAFTIELRDQSGIDRTCHPLFGVPPKGMKTDACSTQGRVIMPNPCDYSTETYARMLCHELGHINGWPLTHDIDRH